MSNVVLERNIIRLQTSYKEAIVQLEATKENTDRRVAELNAAITALGNLWELTIKDDPIENLMEDGPVED